MSVVGWIVVGTVVAVGGYAYVLYPLMLRLVSSLRATRADPAKFKQWPRITITIPVHNEEATIRAKIDRTLRADYPTDRRRILVISDASTDRTDEIVREYEDRGVRLVRLPRRAGKTAAENYAREYLWGDIVVNTDVSAQAPSEGLKALVGPFADPSVGVTSSQNVSVARRRRDAVVGESWYTKYDMWVRNLESKVGGIVGASGAFFASRVDVHAELVPEALSRDFAAPLIARERGYRSVQVPGAVCFVPRSVSLRQEYWRKVRTMTRGLETLLSKRHLLNPLRYGAFSWMLFSHKLARWLFPWTLLALIVLIGGMSIGAVWARWALGVASLFAMAAILGWLWPEARPLPRPIAALAFGFLSWVGSCHAWINALRGEMKPIWEPTRRESGDVRPIVNP